MNYLTTFSIERQAPDMMASLGLSSNFVGALLGIAPITLSRAFRGLQPLPNATGQELRTLLTRLIEFSDAVRPLKLPLDNAEDVKEMLKNFKERDITPSVIRERLQGLFE